MHGLLLEIKTIFQYMELKLCRCDFVLVITHFCLSRHFNTELWDTNLFNPRLEEDQSGCDLDH